MIRTNPDDFVITRKRKKYRFALFANESNCFEVEEWQRDQAVDCLEVGAGTALFSVAQAANDASRSYLAVDVKADRLQKGARKAGEAKVGNCRFLRARVDQLVDLLRPQTLSTIWVTFPDPFPKPRSAKHRLTHPRFLALYRTLLRPSGELCFKTDALPLFQWSLEQLVAQGWQIDMLSFDLHESTYEERFKVMTTYEERFKNERLPIYFLRALPPRH